MRCRPPCTCAVFVFLTPLSVAATDDVCNPVPISLTIATDSFLFGGGFNINIMEDEVMSLQSGSDSEVACGNCVDAQMVSNFTACGDAGYSSSYCAELAVSETVEELASCPHVCFI